MRKNDNLTLPDLLVFFMLMGLFIFAGILNECEIISDFHVFGCFSFVFLICLKYIYDDTNIFVIVLVNFITYILFTNRTYRLLFSHPYFSDGFSFFHILIILAILIFLVPFIIGIVKSLKLKRKKKYKIYRLLTFVNIFAMFFVKLLYILYCQ